MMRFVGVLAAVTAVGLMLAGCPTDSGGGGTGGGNLPPGDPDPSANALLTLNSTISILQRNASGQTNPAFERSSLLTATLVNVAEPGTFTITWQITALGTPGVLSFSSADGTPVLQSTGPQVTVFAVNNPSVAARFRIDALAVSSDTSLSSTLQIEVQPDPISAAGDSTTLSANPFADPAVGFDSSGGVNQVTLFAGDSGPLTRTAFLWEAVDPGSIPVGLALPPVVDRDNPTLVLTVTGDVTGVFPFRVTVTDSIGSKQTGVVNVYLGITELTLDIQVRQVLVASSAVTLQTVRAGGATDFTNATDDAFTYNWSAVDSIGTNVPITVLPESAAADTNPTTLDANLIDWRINGLAAPGVYQLNCTVVDRVGNATNASVAVAMSDALALTVEPTRTEVGTGIGFSLRTIRSSGTGGFTYSFQVLDSSGNDVTAGSNLPTSEIENNVTRVWLVNGQSPDVYNFRVTVRDGDEAVATASTTVAVVDDLTLSAEASRTQIGVGTGFTLRTLRDGGRPDFSYSFLVLDQNGGDVTGGSGLSTTPDNDLDNTWNVNGQIAGTYRFFVTATDGEGRQTTASTTVLVGDALTLDLVGNAAITAPGVPLRLRAQARGGVAPYSFVFSATNAEDADPPGDVFSAVTVVGGNTGAVTYVTSADPATMAMGGYRIRATVSDALGNSAGAAMMLFVTPNPDLMTAARIFNPPAAQLGLFQPSATLNSLGGDIPNDVAAHFVPSNADPGLAFARNLTVRVIDDDAGLVINSITFVGVNQRGEVVDFQLNAPIDLGTPIELPTTPFKRLDRVTVNYTGADNQDTIEIGIGQRFGLARPYSTINEAAADRSFVVVATGASLDTNPESAAFSDPTNNLLFETGNVGLPDRQSISFPLSPPNGANDYIVQFVPLTSITVDVQADDLSLLGSEVANVGISIFGGVPPYSVSYADLGSRTDDNIGPGSFDPASIPAPIFTGTVIEYTAPGVGNDQAQTIRVLVTDAVGDAAVGYVTINVTP